MWLCVSQSETVWGLRHDLELYHPVAQNQSDLLLKKKNPSFQVTLRETSGRVRTLHSGFCIRDIKRHEAQRGSWRARATLTQITPKSYRISWTLPQTQTLPPCSVFEGTLYVLFWCQEIPKTKVTFIMKYNSVAAYYKSLFRLESFIPDNAVHVPYYALYVIIQYVYNTLKHQTLLRAGSIHTMKHFF